MGDRIFHYLSFVACHRRIPRSRQLFNDYLYDLRTRGELSDPLRVFVSDKEFVKIFVSAIAGPKYAVPTLAILRTPSQLRAFEFPSECCIKGTHASGQVVLRAGDAVDVAQIESWLEVNYYDIGREQNYRPLRPKVIVEPLLFRDKNIRDYKFFCYAGEPRIVQVDWDRFLQHKRQYFTADWRPMPISMLYPAGELPQERPANLDEMLRVAGTIAQHFSFARVDLYTDGSTCHVGEITSCPENGLGRFAPQRTGEKVFSDTLFSRARGAA